MTPLLSSKVMNFPPSPSIWRHIERHQSNAAKSVNIFLTVHVVNLWEIRGSNPWSWLTRFSKQTFVLPYNSVVATPKLLSLVEIISWCKGEQVYIPLNKILRGNYFSKNVKIGCPCLSSNYNRIMAHSTTLSQKYSEFPHKNRTCHSWNRCIERVSWTYV